MTKPAVPIADRSIAVLSVFDPNGRTDAGKSYIVFGKTDNTAINLSAIANGTGGFVINSERVWINWNTILVSNAGDVNGDGLDDLIIGAKYAGPNSKVKAFHIWLKKIHFFIFNSCRFLNVI
jgi:hypothetical protein